MANICSNYLTASGDAKQLAELRAKIAEQNAQLLEIFTWFEEGCFYGLLDDLDEIAEGEGDLSLSFTSKWSPPESELLNLSARFPDLQIHVQYEESAMTVYGTLHYFKGQCTVDNPMEEEAYLLEYNEEFKDLARDIANCPYKRFMKKYVDSLEKLEDEPSLFSFGLIEKLILARVQDKDLPLLTNHEWIDSDNAQQFETRLKSNPQEVSNVK
jgi:hypothetical protein